MGAAYNGNNNLHLHSTLMKQKRTMTLYWGIIKQNVIARHIMRSQGSTIGWKAEFFWKKREVKERNGDQAAEGAAAEGGTTAQEPRATGAQSGREYWVVKSPYQKSTYLTQAHSSQSSL